MKILLLMITTIFLVSCSKDMKFSKYSLHQETTKYIVAKYSEETCGMGIDFEGNPTFECDTNYWSKNVSDTWSISARDFKIIHKSAPDSKIVDYTSHYDIKDWPEIRSHSKKNFDRYSKVHKTNYYLMSEGKRYSINLGQLQKIKQKRGDVVNAVVLFKKVKELK